MFMGVDDEGVGGGDGVKGAAGGGLEGGGKGEVAAVGCIDVDAEAVGAVAEGEDLVERIDGAGCGGAEGDDDGADGAAIAGGGLDEAGFEGGEVHRAFIVRRDGFEGQFEDRGDAAVGVVGLVGGEDGACGSELAERPRVPQGWRRCRCW